MNQMKVSVVIPAYNEEASLPQTLEAILRQDYPDFEVIVVNNASTDRTAEIASRFNRVRLVNESRKGLLWAREAGRQAATGQIIANVDADCLPEKNWISNAVSQFTSDKIVAVSGPYDYHDGSKFFRAISSFAQNYIYRFIDLIFKLPFIKERAIMIGGNNFVRASVLEKFGGYNTKLAFYGEDTDTARRIAKYGKVIFSPTIVMKTSARRFQSEGVINLMFKYWYHFFKHIFAKK